MGRTYRTRKRRERTVETHENVDLFRQLKKDFGWRNDNKLSICNFQQTGRGLFARKSIKENETLISLPLDCLITLKTLEDDDNFHDIFEENEEILPFQALLTLYLVYQKNLEGPKFRPYIDSLPKSFTNPYFCSKNELIFLSVPLLKKIVSQNEMIKSSFAIFQKIIKMEFQSILDLDTFKWAFFVVNSRSIFLDPRYYTEKNIFRISDLPNMALAPILDFFNHSSESTNIIRVTKENFELIALNNFRKYEQIFISYGTYNNLHFLVEYGFILPDNSDNFIEITLEEVNVFIKADPELRPLKIQREKYKFIKDHNLDVELFFDENDILSHNLLVILTILFVEPNIYNLKNIAFGEIPSMDDVKDIAKRLIAFKIKEFENFHIGLLKVTNLSECGRICTDFYDNSIKLLNKIVESF